ncbi:MAG: PLP-dependent aminotransferase family protein [Oscillospiraceae bacterium]|nr:PLP-dependent aminotransferase family protein [Oscillospiraceae bacterium]
MYEYLYQLIREDILAGRLKKDEKLPSKRTLAEHLSVSKITVENAYAQLLAEGYIYSKEKKGYFAEDVGSFEMKEKKSGEERPAAEAELQAETVVDLTQNHISERCFPYAVWARTVRRVIMDEPFVRPAPYAGLFSLRQAISDYLYRFRGMEVSPEEIVIGAGTEYLYHLIIQLLGRELCYGVEEPGYRKVERVFQANGVSTVNIPLDSLGVSMEALAEKKPQVLHNSPSHHFPTGIVTAAKRRMELLQWAAAGEDRYILEDDYDCEFRFSGRPIPTLQSLDNHGRVIYMNTFSKSLSPSMRVSYMILPRELMERFAEKLSFYACTVPVLDQSALASFIAEGHFEKHLNRARKYYRGLCEALSGAIAASALKDKVTLLEADAGLHFLLQVKSKLTDAQLTDRLEKEGLRVRLLRDYFAAWEEKQESRCLVINYASIEPEKIGSIIRAMEQALA